MKKIILIFALLSLPAFATDIPYTNNSYTSSTCDSGVLQHDSGTVRLRARYEPNTMNIRWYNNNTEIVPTNSAANTCNYDSALTLPANQPTRTGYAFAGWRVRPLIDFRTLGLLSHTVSTGIGYGKGVWKGDDNCGYYDGNQWPEGGPTFCSSNNEFTELERYEWKATFKNADILYGISMCSKKPGDNHSWSWNQTYRSDWQEASTETLKNYTGNDAASEAKYCWCKATGYKANSNAVTQGSEQILGWVFDRSSTSGVFCERSCAYLCGAQARDNAAGRSGLFTPVDNAD